MSFMMSEVVDYDGSRLIASCPFYHDVPLCVNSCALFVPERLQVDGEWCIDYRYGRCGLAQSKPQRLEVVPEEVEEEMRRTRSRTKRL